MTARLWHGTVRRMTGTPPWRLALAVGLAVSLSQPAAAETLNLAIAARAANYAPYIIAIEKGYYAAAGLAINVTYTGGAIEISGLIAGSIDVGTSTAASVSAILRGAPLRIIDTLSDRPSYQLWSTRPDLKTLADLKGATVGIISRGDALEVAMRLTLQQAGLPPDWVGYTALGSGNGRVAAAESGALPAVIEARRDIELMRDRSALPRGHLITDMYRTIRFPYGGQTVAVSMLKNRPLLVRRFLLATVKGARYMTAFRAETIAILVAWEQSADPRGAEADYDDVVATLTANGIADAALRQHDLDVRASFIGLPADRIPPLDAVYDYSPLEEVNAALDASGWTPTP
jgi:ABC-type nitrate/sulfonate/bicarbonate transport system substrate-binding protein